MEPSRLNLSNLSPNSSLYPNNTNGSSPPIINLSNYLPKTPTPFNDTDHNKNLKNFGDDLKNGSAVILGVNETEIIPPSGKSIFTKEEREQKLKQVALLSSLNSPGCSLVIHIFGDKLRECIQKIQRETLHHKGFKELIKSWSFDIELMLASLLNASFNVSNLYSAVTFTNGSLDIENIRSQFLEMYTNLVPAPGQLAIPQIVHVQNIVNKSKGCKELLDTIILLKDFAYQETHSLFELYEPNPDLSYHISRISTRANNLSQVLKSQDLFALTSKEVIQNYGSLLDENKKKQLEFYEFISTESKKLENNCSTEKLISCWLSLEAYRIKDDENHIENKIGSKLYQDHKEMKNQTIEFSRLTVVSNMLKIQHLTILDELYIVLIDRLLKASNITNSEIDACIESLISAANGIKNFNTYPITKQLKSIPQDDSCSVELKSLWDYMTKNSENALVFPTLIQQLKNHFARSSKNPSNRILRIMMLRKALHSIANYIFDEENIKISQRLNSIAKKIDHFDHQGDNYQKLIRIHQEIQDFHNMRIETLTAALESIKALLGRGLAEMDNLLKSEKTELDEKKLKAEEAAAELLQMCENEKKQKNAKRNNRRQPVKKSPEIKPVEVKTTSKVLQPLFLTNSYIFNETLTPFKPITKTVTSFQNINVETSLALCKNLNAKLNESDLFAKDNWQTAQADNLRLLLSRLAEISEVKDFSADQIFEQVDVTRRIVEAILDISTIYAKTPLDRVKEIGHDTKSLAYFLLKETKIPESLKKLLWQLREVPFMLCEANKCVNYPMQSYVERSKLSDEGEALINFLMQVDREGNSSEPNLDSRSVFVAEQKYLLKMALYFTERMLSVIINPSQVIEEKLPIQFPENSLLKNSSLVNDLISSESNPSQTITNNLNRQESTLPLSITSREQGLSAIESAIAWIAIRSISPVEGPSSSQMRKTERNIALENCSIYLHRLKEKLSPERCNKPMSTVLGQCELIRRLQKELVIAALYHGNHIKDGEPLVNALNIRYENNPVILMDLLKQVSNCAKNLPSVAPWIYSAHMTLSYPTPLTIGKTSFNGNELQLLIQKVHAKSTEKSQVLNEEILVLSGRQKKTPQKRYEERKKLVEKNETLRIYPEIASILHTLKNGFIIPKNIHLS